MAKNEDVTHEQQILIPVLRKASSWGADDPKIVRPYMLAKGMVKHLEFDDATIDEIDFFADRLMDKLESALMYYQLIYADDFNSRNISQRRTIYEGLYANLWSFYKGRVQNYLKKMGWNLEIFFCNDKTFDKAVERFLASFPGHDALIGMAREQRQAWQTSFGNSRNASEHSGDYRNGIETYETKKDAKRLFAQVCWTAETVMAYCGSYKMKREWNVTEINPDISVFDDKDRYIIEHALQTARRKRAR